MNTCPVLVFSLVIPYFSGLDFAAGSRNQRPVQKVEEEEDEEGGGEDPPCDLPPPLFSFPFVALFLLKSLRPDSKRGRMLLLVLCPQTKGLSAKKRTFNPGKD